MFGVVASSALAGGLPVHVEPGPVTGPPEVTLAWADADGCRPALQVTNGGTAPIEVDWSRSTLSSPGSGAVSIVPGTATGQAAALGIPPSVVPPGSFVAERIFEKGLSGCMARGPATLTLSVSGQWVTQEIELVPSFELLRSRAIALDFSISQVCVLNALGPGESLCAEAGESAAAMVSPMLEAFRCDPARTELVLSSVRRHLVRAPKASKAFAECVANRA